MIYHGENYFSGDEYNSGDELISSINEILDINKPEEQQNGQMTIEEKINFNMFLAFSILFLLLFGNFLILRLIFKKKSNKIIWKIFIALNIIISLAFLVAIILGFYYFEEIKLIYELYYLFS